MPPSTSLFALIIGIIHYQYDDPCLVELSYAATDAQALSHFLGNKLSVPKDNIRLLLNEHASRGNIIKYIRDHLTHNPAIKKGDPILFYYSGHGTSYPAPQNWPTDDGWCEAICPADRREPRDDRGDQGRLASADILDRTLGALFAEMALLKGNNITVIMDCCHSGSITRSSGPGLAGLRTRFAPPLQSPIMRDAMFAEVSQIASTDPAAPRHIRPMHSLRDPSQTSHMLLAACMQDQQAYEWEVVQQGVFTHALLTALSTSNSTPLTYEALWKALVVPEVLKPHQTPQCEGLYKHRLLFDGRSGSGHVRAVNPLLVPVSSNPNGGLRVEAGEIHGVTPGTTFTIKSSPYYNGQDFTEAIAVEVYAVWCTVRPAQSIARPPAGCFAMVKNWANIASPFIVNFSAPMQTQMNALIDGGRSDGDQVHMVFTNDSRAAAIVVAYQSSREIVVKKQDVLTVEADCPRISKWPLGGSVDALKILNLCARFNFHLYRESLARPFQRLIRMSLLSLDVCTGELEGGNLIRNGRANLEEEADASYAIMLHNDSDVDLWCSMFYFDPSDYSIRMQYSPPSSNMKPPLRRHSELTFGYGSTATQPFRFSTKDGEEHDAGFMKVFISSQYADLSLMAQGSIHARPECSRGGELPTGPGIWDTLMVIIDVHSSDDS